VQKKVDEIKISWGLTLGNFSEAHSTLSTAGRGAFTATDSNDIPLAAEAPFDPEDDLLPARALTRGVLLGLAMWCAIGVLIWLSWGW
jgi:hypothetical protein